MNAPPLSRLDRPTLPSQGECLLRAVLAHPGDDLPRLAYADWLLEEGSPTQLQQGAFIQAQVAIARIHRASPCPGEACPCQPHVSAAIRAGIHEWQWTLRPDGMQPAWAYVPHTCLRGFWNRVCVPSLADWLAIADDLLNCQPVRQLEIRVIADREEAIRIGQEASRRRLTDFWHSGDCVCWDMLSEAISCRFHFRNRPGFGLHEPTNLFTDFRE